MALFNEVADCASKAGAAGWLLSGTPLHVGDVFFRESSVVDSACIAFGSVQYRAAVGFAGVDGFHLYFEDPFRTSREDLISIVHGAALD